MTPRATRRARRDSTIGLINVVFLMLIFFLIAGTVASPPQAGVQLIALAESPTPVPPDALIVAPDGGIRLGDRVFAGTVEAAALAYLARLTEPRVARLIPDRTAPASVVVALADALRRGGATRVVVLGERRAR